MILLWGIPSDEPLMVVREALRRLEAPCAFLDQRSVLETEIELSVGAAIDGRLRVGEDEIDLGKVTGVYLRPYDSRRMPEVASAGPDSREERHAIQVEEALLSWVEVTPARVLNRPSSMSSNTSKPYQAALIRKHGFAIPETLITTDSRAALDFRSRHGSVIYKSVSGVRSIVSRLGPEQEGRMDDLCWCPTQFQEYVEGTDFRVHVVGDEVFACEIVSVATDYRYASLESATIEMRACELPDDCAALCRALAAALDLSLAGIDLRRTPDGAWYCFEVNPSPGFTFFQKAAGHAIDEAVARFLIAA